MKQEEAPQPHFCKHLQRIPAAKHAGFPLHSPLAPAQQGHILLPPVHGKAIQPHNVAADEDVNSFCQSFLWYFIGDWVSLLMIPTFIVPLPTNPSDFIPTPPIFLEGTTCEHLQNCLQMSPKNFVAKQSRKW